MRDPARIPKVLAALQAYWDKHPDLRLGQIIVNLSPRKLWVLNDGYDPEDPDAEINMMRADRVKMADPFQTEDEVWEKNFQGERMIKVFKTLSGSVYQLDEETKMVRRCFGQSPSTKRIGNDGEWKPYLTAIYSPKGLLVVWEVVDGVNKATLTSPITETMTMEAR
jgi:hypothetical protein